MPPNRKNKVSIVTSNKAKYGSGGPFCHCNQDNCRYETEAYECDECNTVHRFSCHESYFDNLQEMLEIYDINLAPRCAFCHTRNERRNGRPGNLMDVIKIATGEPSDNLSPQGSTVAEAAETIITTTEAAITAVRTALSAAQMALETVEKNISKSQH